MTATGTVTVQILLFARYAELAGRERMSLSFNGMASVADAVLRLRDTVPGLGVLPPRPLCAVNASQADPTHMLSDGDELAILPPVAGG
ncbi:MAG: MoaD/ThiS family protein [Gemmatimonadales bacterium]